MRPLCSIVVRLGCHNSILVLISAFGCKLHLHVSCLCVCVWLRVYVVCDTALIACSCVLSSSTYIARKTTEIGNPKRAHASNMSNLNPSMIPAKLIWLLLGLFALPCPVAAGSCREAQLCCNGRDSSCVVQKAPINAIIEDLSDKPCYCDHACLKLGDCCDDFKDHCGGEWEQSFYIQNW